MLSLVASASSLVLEVLGACTMTEAIRSPVSQTLEVVTGVKLPLDEFERICRHGALVTIDTSHLQHELSELLGP